MKLHLTDAIVKRLPVPEKGHKITWDDSVVGFGVRVSAGGARSYVLRYRLRETGHEHASTIGRAEHWRTTWAREEAKKLKREIDLGNDPFEPDDPRSAIAEKWLSFINKAIEPACYLYRHYHTNGDLLYVGVSLYALVRQDRHLKKAAWRASIYQIVIEPFETREQALEAEQLAIKTEFPKFNTMHNGHRHPLRELAQIEKAETLLKEDVKCPN